MFCFENHKDLIKMYEYIKNNKRCINKKIKLLNLKPMKILVTNFITKFNFPQLQSQVYKIYNFMRFNKNINSNLIEYMFIFATITNVNDMVDFIYTVINDKHFYKNLKDIFKSLSDISKCIAMSGTTMNKSHIETIIKFYNHDIGKVKKIFKLSTYNLLVALCMVYKEPPTTIFKIKLGAKNPKYIKGRHTIKKEFKNKFPKANLNKLNSDDKIGVMYFALNHIN
jgi:hypothetical protein